MKFHTDGTLPMAGDIFVFGSNLAGRHGAGAAKVAAAQFGAKFGARLIVRTHNEFGLPEWALAA